VVPCPTAAGADGGDADGGLRQLGLLAAEQRKTRQLIRQLEALGHTITLDTAIAA
jgi:hypothetical protein